jgi:hypothetical protein
MLTNKGASQLLSNFRTWSKNKKFDQPLQNLQASPKKDTLSTKKGLIHYSCGLRRPNTPLRANKTLKQPKISQQTISMKQLKQALAALKPS